MTVTIVLACCAGLLLAGLAAAMAGRAARAMPAVYGATAAICTLACLAALSGGGGEVVLPIGLPWLGAHFRLDALAGGVPGRGQFRRCRRGLYALGYGRHEAEPRRVLPFFPAFIAGMNLVVIAADAYTLPVRLGSDVAHLLGAGHGRTTRAEGNGAPASSISSWRLSAR